MKIEEPPSNKNNNHNRAKIFKRYTLIISSLIIITGLGIGFSSWQLGENDPVEASVSAGIANAENRDFNVSASAIESNLYFDTPSNVDPSLSLNGLITSNGGKEDLSFVIRLGFEYESYDETSFCPIRDNVDSIKVGFAFSSNEDPLFDLINKGYLALPTSIPMEAIFSPLSSNSNGKLIYPSSSSTDGSYLLEYSEDTSTNNGLLDLSKLNPCNIADSYYFVDSKSEEEDKVYELYLSYSFRWGEYFDYVNPVYTPVEFIDQKIEANNLGISRLEYLNKGIAEVVALNSNPGGLNVFYIVEGLDEA